ncbi:DMT family transporter [Vannielia litorea]|uniref:Threonine/homoserine efflux transporter RhtA n=1 Tax=Vannielia litorea TaxID=1217970 RepID=A0A1N6EF24_9RHOB|nr:DMT family transporter [Vannielia litorea]SIN81655.1 Threonine/homoserine efflux transporter RhtA [Vannielia litorea]
MATVSPTDVAPSRPVAGVLWMVLTGILFVFVTASVKFTGGRVPAPQAAFLRYALGLVFILPMIPAIRADRLGLREMKIFAARGAGHTVGVMLWFYGMSTITIAEVTALNYMSPVYVTLGAVFFLGETMALRRILAVLAALGGALIILRPGMRELEPGHWAMVGAALCLAASYLIAKQVSGRVSAATLVAMLSVTVSVGLAPFAWAVWVPVSWHDLGILFLTAAFATGAHYAMGVAFKCAPVTVTQPVTFLQLIWAVLLGYFVFDEGIDAWVLVGGTAIIAAISFITWREAVVSRRQVTPVSGETKF